MPVADIAQARETENFHRLMEFQIERAARLLPRRVLEAARRRTAKPQRAGIVMAAIYQTLLEEIRADGCHVLTQRTSLTPVRKLWIAWKTWIKG